MTEEYSSGLISQSFWFTEMKKLILLRGEGKSVEELKKTCIEENLFGTTNEYRAKRLCGYMLNRLNHLDQNLIDIFLSSDLATQKAINLIAILNGDRLFFEFLYEVYREKNILGAQTIDRSDVGIFFRNKEIQSNVVEQWTDATKKRLASLYINFMTDANLLTECGNEKKITPPILDSALEWYCGESGNMSMFKAITGVK